MDAMAGHRTWGVGLGYLVLIHCPLQYPATHSSDVDHRNQVLGVLHNSKGNAATLGVSQGMLPLSTAFGVK